MEKRVLVSLFKPDHPIKQLFVEGPARLNLGSEERLTAGLYKITLAGRFNIEEQKNGSARPKRSINASSFAILPLNRPLRIGRSASKLRRYRGEIKIEKVRDGISCTNIVDMKDYVNSVVGSESLVDFPEEALKAQSVLVQTAMQRYRAGDELNDSTEKQAYLGADFEREIVREAVRKTWGEHLLSNGRDIPIYFHSCCAGGTSKSAYFSGKESGFQADAAVACEYCKGSPFWKETIRTVPITEYRRIFKEGIPHVFSTDNYKRAITLKYPSGKEERAYQYWLLVGQKFGWDKMPGTRFSVTEIPGQKVEFRSRGAGHGVGLCQWGAAGMARQGKKYEQILELYFPGAKLARR